MCDLCLRTPVDLTWSNREAIEVFKGFIKKYCINGLEMFTGSKVIGHANLILRIRIIFNSRMRILCSQWLVGVWNPFLPWDARLKFWKLCRCPSTYGLDCIGVGAIHLASVLNHFFFTHLSLIYTADLRSPSRFVPVVAFQKGVRFERERRMVFILFFTYFFFIYFLLLVPKDLGRKH